jgi:hypothetical protein
MLLPVACCSASETVPIVDFENSKFNELNGDQMHELANKSWSIAIIEGKGPPWDEGREFYIPNARGVLQEIVDRCKLGPTYLTHGYHGYANLLIEESPLESEKIKCIQASQRRGIQVHEPSGLSTLRHNAEQR